MHKETPNKVCEVLAIHSEAQARDNQDFAWTRYLVKAAKGKPYVLPPVQEAELLTKGRRVGVATLASFPSNITWVKAPEMHFYWDHRTVPTRN